MNGYDLMGAEPQYLMGSEGGYVDIYGNTLANDPMGGVVGAAGGPQIMNTPGGRRLIREQYTEEKGLQLPLGRQTVAASTSAEFSNTPQVPFRPSSLVISATSITGLTVDNILVGKNGQFTASGAMPAAAFGADSTFKGMKYDTARPGINVVVQVTDVSAVANVVVMGMFGIAAE